MLRKLRQRPDVALFLTASTHLDYHMRCARERRARSPLVGHTLLLLSQTTQLEFFFKRNSIATHLSSSFRHNTKALRPSLQLDDSPSEPSFQASAPRQHRVWVETNIIAGTPRSLSLNWPSRLPRSQFPLASPQNNSIRPRSRTSSTSALA